MIMWLRLATVSERQLPNGMIMSIDCIIRAAFQTRSSEQ